MLAPYLLKIRRMLMLMLMPTIGKIYRRVPNPHIVLLSKSIYRTTEGKEHARDCSPELSRVECGSV